jgi:hypothetical protein
MVKHGVSLMFESLVGKGLVQKGWFCASGREVSPRLIVKARAVTVGQAPYWLSLLGLGGGTTTSVFAAELNLGNMAEVAIAMKGAGNDGLAALSASGEFAEELFVRCELMVPSLSYGRRLFEIWVIERGGCVDRLGVERVRGSVGGERYRAYTRCIFADQKTLLPEVVAEIIDILFPL